MEDRIRAGEYPPGSLLPSARELGDMYSIGTSTANKVYLILKVRGLAEGFPGVGVFVVDRLPPTAER